MLDEITDELRRDWQVLKAAPSGERFQRLYVHCQQPRRGFLAKLVTIAVGLLLAAAGLIMMVTPGPGTVALLIGLAVLARQSTLVARAIDATESRLHPLASRFTRTLRRRRRTS